MTALCTGRVPSNPSDRNPSARRESNPIESNAIGTASASMFSHGKSGGGVDGGAGLSPGPFGPGVGLDDGVATGQRKQN